MYHTWLDLLFLHWAYDPQEIQPGLPPGLTVDTFDGKAYVGIVPFFMRNVRPRFVPAVPGLSNFMEANVRTYVYDERGVAGIWFYSLDANQWLAVKGARTFFRLPYFYAEMESARDQTGQEINYTTRRKGVEASSSSRFRYRGKGLSSQAEPGTFEFFVIERYILFSYIKSKNLLLAGQVHHSPYPICEADVPDWDTNLIELDGLTRPDREPDHIVMSPGVEVEVFALATANPLDGHRAGRY